MDEGMTHIPGTVVTLQHVIQNGALLQTHELSISGVLPLSCWTVVDRR